MRYEIKGEPMPVVECFLERDESINCENGGMSWMSDNMEMSTTSGGLGSMFSKALTGESIFLNTYTARDREGMIAFASSFPGNILAIELLPGQELLCQKSAYLASTPGITLSIAFQKKLGAGLFGGEGFIMQRLSGSGLVFVELDGSIVTKELAEGERILVDTGYVAMMDGTCSMDIRTVRGLKNVMLGGEGAFHTEVTGPGRVFLQTMPCWRLAGQIRNFMPIQNH